MPYRESFECLWCGRAHRVRSAADLEGWAQLCPDCVGRAGDNGFLRFRLKTALAERARDAPPAGATGSPDPVAATRSPDAEVIAGQPGSPALAPSLGAGPAPAQPPAPGPTPEPVSDASLRDEMLAYYAARAPEYDDWYLRRGRYARGAIHDVVWQVDLDVATRWLDAQPIGGTIVELAAGTGWWSPLLAQKGELWAYDGADEPLERARERLLAHGLRAHLHVRDAWAEPDREVDSVFAGFWLSHVPRNRLPAFLRLVRSWLKPGGSFAFIDSRPDPQSGASDHERDEIAPDVQLRRLADGREFRVVKVHYTPEELEPALRTAGLEPAGLGATSRFFIYGRAVAT